MIRKIFKSGNSEVISLPKEMLKKLEIGEGSEVSVEFDSDTNQITIRPVKQDEHGIDEKFARQVSDFIDEYREALNALAKG